MGSMQFLRLCHIASRLLFKGLPLGRLCDLNPSFVCALWGDSDDGVNETRSWRAGAFVLLLRTLPRKRTVLTSIRTSMLGILLNLDLIFPSVILYFWTRCMLRPMMRLIWRVANLSNLSKRSFRRAQDSQPHSRRLMGMAMKIKYFEYTFTCDLLKKPFKAPMAFPAPAILPLISDRPKKVVSLQMPQT